MGHEHGQSCLCPSTAVAMGLSWTILSFARQNALVGSITRVVGVLGLAGMIETSSPVAVLILSLFILYFLFESCFDTAASLFRGTRGLVVLPVFDQLRIFLLVFSHTEHHETLILRR